MMLAMLIALPLLFGFFLLFIQGQKSAWALCLAALAVDFLLLIFCYYAGILEVRVPWLSEWGLYFHLRLDALSGSLALVASLMGVMAMVGSFGQIFSRPGLYYGNLLILLAGVNGVLLAADLLLFFICWEAMILPLYFAISFWGHGNKRAAIQFFIFTQGSGLLMLVAILGLYFVGYAQTGVFSFDPQLLSRIMLDEPTEILLFSGFMIAFLVKLPACPFHVWIADIFADAPLAPVLMGIMVKTGAYAIIRFALPLFPNASLTLAPVMIAIGVFGIFYGALLAYSQSDIRKILAYSTISHMGMVLIALFCHHELARIGAVVLLITGSITTGSLLLLFAETKSYNLGNIGGIFKEAPKISVITLFLVMASVGLPLFGNFVGEWFVMIGIFATYEPIAVLVGLGLVVSAVYHLRLVKRLLFGKSHGEQKITELSSSRLFLYGGLIAFLLIIGLYPAPLLSNLADNLSESRGQYD